MKESSVMMKSGRVQKQIMKNAKKIQDGSLPRDDSPVSVISQNASLSQASSASGSMEHHLFQPPVEPPQSLSISVEASSTSSLTGSDSESQSHHGNRAQNSATKIESLDDSADSDCMFLNKERRREPSEGPNKTHKSRTNIMTSVDISSPTRDHGEPVMCSFSASLKECHIRKLQATFSGESEALEEYEEELLEASPDVLMRFRFKEKRRRPASMDLIADINNNSSSNAIARDGSYSCSPRFGINSRRDLKAKENLQRLKPNDYQKLRVFPSPNIYRHGGVLGLHTRKPLPSKWDDAEKWLCSPGSLEKTANSIVSKSGDFSNCYVPYRPKSKSGPLNSLGLASPNPTLYYGRNRGSLLQPCSYQPGALSNQKSVENLGRESFYLPSYEDGENLKYTRSNSVDGWSFQSSPMPPLLEASCKTQSMDGEQIGDNGFVEFDHSEQETKDGDSQSQVASEMSQHYPRAKDQLPDPAFPVPQDKHADTVLETPRLYASSTSSKQEMRETETLDNAQCKGSLLPTSVMKDAATEISPAVSRRDIATQMTPLESSKTSRSPTPHNNVSPARHNTPARVSNSGCNSSFGTSELESSNNENSNMPMLIASGKKLISPRKNKGDEVPKCRSCLESDDWMKNIMEARALDWEDAERTKWMARYKREEAKIIAWENHQKAKAEASLKKLEVKLEKLRSNKTEKIMNKLSNAMKRAEEMRATIAAQQADQVVKVLNRAASLRKTGHSTPHLGACFSFSSCNV